MQLARCGEPAEPTPDDHHVRSSRIGVQRLRTALVGLSLPRAVDGRLMLAVDVSAWLRPDAVTSPGS